MSKTLIKLKPDLKHSNLHIGGYHFTVNTEDLGQADLLTHQNIQVSANDVEIFYDDFRMCDKNDMSMSPFYCVSVLNDREVQDIVRVYRII